MLTNLFGVLVQFGVAILPDRRNRGIAFRHAGITACVAWLMMVTALHAQGTWTQLANQNPSGANGSMLLMTDGTVLVSQSAGFSSKVWSKLTPDATGNYINGTWSNVASMSLERLYTGSVVLPSGKLFILGGEYTGPFSSPTWDNTGEIYDPLANTWSATAPFPRSEFGDGQAVLLPSGKVFVGDLNSDRTFLYDPTFNSWAQTGRKLRMDRNNEETWLLLPGGGVLCYEIFSSPPTGAGFAQRYVTAGGTWVNAGSVPVPLSSASLGYEMGPAGLLPDGRAIQIGANNNTAIYTPSTNTWAAGPTLPSGMGADDSPGAVLPDGQFIFAADTSVPNFTPPTRLFNFDYTSNTLTDVTPGGALGTELANAAAYETRMLVLPNGHLLMNAGGSRIYDYAPAGSPLAAWRPTISSVVKTTTTTYTLTGTLLTGISEGANYGDDAGLSTNYPIVRLTSSSGVVKYARTTNWTPGVSAVGDTTLTSVKLTLPTGLGNGTYQLAVIANGIASTNFPFTIGPPLVPSIVTTKYVPGTKTLTLTGDNLANVLTVTLQNGKINIEAANGTKIIDLNVAPPPLPLLPPQLSSVSYPHTGQLVLKADLLGGDDSISVVGVDSSTTDIKLGAGADKVAVTLCNISTLKIDGGFVAGGTVANFWDGKVDTLITTSSTITTQVLTNFP